MDVCFRRVLVRKEVEAEVHPVENIFRKQKAELDICCEDKSHYKSGDATSPEGAQLR